MIAYVPNVQLISSQTLTDDGKPPLELPGLILHERLQAIQHSLDRVLEKGGTCLN